LSESIKNEPARIIPTVGAVVVTYNRKELLTECLDGILGQSRPVDGLYVVDNASTDGTESMIRERYTGLVTYARLPQNVGGAGGFHYGMRTAYENGYEYIWIMDDDVRPARDCLQFLLNASSHANVLAPLHLSVDGDLADANYVREMAVSLKDYIAQQDAIPEVVEMKDVSFEGPLFHRSIVATAGLPRSDFFTWGEDGEYSWRLSKLGLGPICCITSAKVARLLPNVISEFPPWRYYYSWRNALFVHRHYAPNFRRRLWVDIRFLLSMIRGLAFPRRHDGPAQVKFQAWLDSFRDPMPTRYLPPTAKARN
jgi:rhamnopyranosyl-N-acetylglucosaminyl-diphospho-decaprenol beta-1,3/1,4-galactofuranosyltransferase